MQRDTSQSVIFRLHQMHGMQTIVTDDRGVCQSLSQSVYHAPQLGGACSVCGVIRCSLCQITFASC